jgi:cytidyltransferase-like protein
MSADIFHFGHLKLIQEAKRISDYHICGLYSDKLCLDWNGSLIMNYKERVAVLESLNDVDEVIEQELFDPTSNLKYIHEKFPRSKIVFFQGHQDWIGLPGTNYVKSIGGKFIKPEYYPKLARSKIRDSLNSAVKNTSYDIESYLLGDVSYFAFHNSTKANTLASLKPKLINSEIEELFVFTILQWQNSKAQILQEIKEKFSGKIVVRSSSLLEDSQTSSYAGFFHSELNIDSDNLLNIRESIEKVIKSYSKEKNNSINDQILVQSQTEDVIVSGVVFSRNLENNSPYYLINYDESSITDTVTSGKVGKKLEIIKNIDLKRVASKWQALIKSIREIESLLHNLALDIEFALKKNGKVVIFQVRPITANKEIIDVPDNDIYNSIKSLQNKYKKEKKLSLHNENYTLSDMSFWNPAEIIGDRSDNLSYSLYRYLILSRPWNLGLLPLGYRKIDRDLIVRFGNKPYIEVETAFASLLPASLDDNISNKLINHYSDKLKNNPELHDKIEFDIVHNCFSPTTDSQLEELKKILNNQELNSFRKSLVDLTENIFKNYTKIKNEDLVVLKNLSNKREKLLNSLKSSTLNQKLEIVVNLLDDARTHGTPQFSRMARLAFIGKQFLNGIMTTGAINNNEYDLFFSNINTVATQISKDFDKVISKKMSVGRFKKLYGHLRPGTYDIKKSTYQDDNGYFKINQVLENNSYEPKLDEKKLKEKIGIFLNDFEISLTPSKLLNFISETTKYRESFKFEFTKNLSLSLNILSEVGLSLGLNKSSLSFLTIESIKGVLNSNLSKSEIADFWKSQIDGKLSNDKIFDFISLPSLIFDIKDFEIIKSHTIRPNFITNSTVKGELINLDNIDSKNYDSIFDKIVLIEKADPGYDWIFSKKIKGLITRFGGAASHMAIRCSEFKLPAAIGCGKIIYDDLKDKKSVLLDCKSKMIKSI